MISITKLTSNIRIYSSVSANIEWQHNINSSYLYQISSFMYCLAGGLLLLKPEPLERGLSIFPWRITGLCVFFNGFCSYMADTITWSQPKSIWKKIDILIATLNVLLQIAIVILSIAGFSTFTFNPVICLGISIIAGILFKCYSAEAMRKDNLDAYIYWHAHWHISIPLGACLGQIMLYKSCDWMSTYPCNK